MKKRIFSFLLAVAMLCTMLPQVFVEAEAAAVDDYTQWKQYDAEWNQNQAWTKSHYPNATLFYMRDGGCLVTSIAMLLRHYNVIVSSDVDVFNPWICNEALKAAGAFDSAADLYFGRVENAYPGMKYIGSMGYSLENLNDLYNAGYACVIKVNGSGGYYHFVAVRSISGDNVSIMDPGSGATSLSAYGTKYEIYYYAMTPGCLHNYNNLGVCTSTCKAEYNWQATYDTSSAGVYEVTLGDGIYLRTDKPYAASTAKSEFIKAGTEVEVLGSVTNAVGTEHHLWYKVSYNGITGYTSENNLTCITKYADNTPLAVCDEVTGGEGSVRISGWAFDPDTPGESVTIHVYIDNTLVGAYTANKSRPDVNNVYGCGEYHGFAETVPYDVSTTGTHSVAVYALNTTYGKEAVGMGPYSTTISAHSHSYTGKVTVEPYCGGTGIKTYTCSGCSASYTETIPATGAHTWGGWGVKQAATCTASGIKARKCPVCYQEETQTIAATGHSYGSWVTTKTAGCTTTGTKKKTCSSCGDVQTQTISATGHNYKSETISGNGAGEVVRYTCKNCGDTYEISTSGKYSEWSTTKPTGVAENLIETKTQYRYRSIEYTTTYSDWGSWSSWQDSSVSETNLRDVETRTVYPYYYFYCKKCGDSTRWYSYGGNCGACGTTMESSSGTVVWLTTPWSEAVAYRPYGSDTGKYAIHINGLAYWKWTDGSPKTQYRYRTRTETETVSYGSWSSWGDTAYTETSSRDVETRTIYRYWIEETQYHKPGDIDSNGSITSEDVVQLLLHISMPDMFTIDAPADFDADGIVTTDDAIKLLLHISMPDMFPL